MAGIRGHFVWHELTTTDTAAAEKYYTKVVGWSTKPYPESDEPYTMWMTGEARQGGLMALPEMAKQAGAPPHWLTYISVDDVDAAAEKLKGLGGALHYGPMDIPDVGRFAIVADPQRATFALFAPRGESMRPPAPGAGAFSWHELTTTDTNRAWAFYSEMFGWQKTDAMDMGEGETYQMFGVSGGPSMGGISKRAGAPPSWLPYVVVKDVDEATEQVKANGGTVLMGPMEVPGGDRIVVASDPQGAVLGVHQRVAS